MAMRIRSVNSVLIVTMVAILCSAARGQTTQPATAQSQTAQAETAKVVAAANAFLATLDTKQRAAVVYAFNDDSQRVRWSNFPTGFVPRGGLSLGELNDAQR